MNLKSFLIGFFLSTLINIVLIVVLGVNFSHSALISKLSTETGFVNIASSESGAEKLANIVAINLASDYCSARSLGNYFFVFTSEIDNQTLGVVDDYLKQNKLSVECKV
jgi:hypothetical protein